MLFNFIKKPQLVFLVLSLTFGSLSALLVPQLSVNDEQMHYLRAYTVSSGDVAPEECKFPKQVTDQAKAAQNREYSEDYTGTINLTDKIPYSCGSAASYSPTMYLPQALGVLLAQLTYPSSGVIILLGRLFNLLFYSLAVYFIIKHVRLGKWVFVAIGTLPVMIHTAASLSGDVVNNVAILAFIAMTLSLFAQTSTITKKQIALLMILGCLLALTKPTNILLFTPLLLLPTRVFQKNSTSRIPFNIHKWSLGVCLAMASILCIVLWQYIHGAPLVAQAVLAHENISPLKVLFNTYLNPALGYTDFVTKGVVGSFSSYKYNLPIFAIVLSFGLLVTTLFYRERSDRSLDNAPLRWAIISNVLVLIMYILAVTYAMYTQWAVMPQILGPKATWAEGVQGRYFTPFLALLIPLAIWMKKYIHINTKSTAHFGAIVFVWSGLILAYYIFQTYWTFRLL